jgi:hypothetical protein
MRSAAQGGHRRWPSVTERLLEHGRTVDDPDQQERTELARLEEQGLIEVAWSRYFLCVDHADDRDLVHAHDRVCNHKIPLIEGDHPDDPFQREDDRYYECGGCGRLHWPGRRERTTYQRATVTVSLEQAAGWLGAQLQGLDSAPYRLHRGGVWRLRHGDSEAHVCLLDGCLDTRFATREFAVFNNGVFVVLDHRVFADRFIDADWLRAVTLHSIAERGVVALQERLDELGSSMAPLAFREPTVRPWAPVRQPAPRVTRRVLGMHKLELLVDRALLDGVEVVPPEATAQLRVLEFFAARYREDLLDGKRPEDHCLYSPEEVLDDLQERRVASTEAPGTVRRQITRLRNLVAQRYLDETGIKLDQDEFIENVAGAGFRLNAGRVVSREPASHQWPEGSVGRDGLG